jgi:uncharacterized protein GlcG (DUF336 family)
MSRASIESLETRRHLSAAVASQPLFHGADSRQATHVPFGPAASADAQILRDSQPEVLSGINRSGNIPNFELNLSAAQVSQILAQAASQARPGQAVAVADREGKVLGVYATTGATQATINAAITRARTGGYFQSTQNAFSTRTARFIIQDHFPWPIRNTGGGPLYGVQFSSLPGTDILDNPTQTPGISGDPGGLPLFIDGLPAGGIGVAGDGRDVAPRFDLAAEGQRIFNGKEESDFDESVALAGASGLRAPLTSRINAMAPKLIRATSVILPGTGLRFPFVASKEARANEFRTLDQLVAAGLGTVITAPTSSLPNPFPKVAASVYGIPGELKNTTQPGFGVVPSNDSDPIRLTTDDVNTIISDAVSTALTVRAAIRLPIGVPAIVHIAVVDRDGDVLGVFRMNDGTNFSFDVAVQKGRTAAFFSDDSHAFSTRGIGFMSQKFFPAGITAGGTSGPLFQLQNRLSLTPGNLGRGPLANGITIFPGGVPLYKDGVLVGAIGISGDGVEQDDQIAFGGAAKFQPRAEIRIDRLSSNDIRQFTVSKVEQLQQIYNLGTTIRGQTFAEQADLFLRAKPGVRFPYVKFARNPIL